MTQGKRVRDAEVHRIHDAFQNLLGEVAAYHDRLVAELADERSRSEPYPHLVAALDRQIARVAEFREQLEDEGLSAVVDIANTSGYVAHARTREFF
jgi:hypothetical protein